MEVASEVKSGVAVAYANMDVCVKFGDTRLSRAELFDSFPVGPVLRYFVQYSIVLFAADRKQLAQSYPADRCIKPTVRDKCVKFRDPRLNRCGEIRPKAVRGGIFGCFSNFYTCEPEVAGDVIPGVASVYVGVDVRAKFGDF